MPDTELHYQLYELRHEVPYGVTIRLPDTAIAITQSGPGRGWRVDHYRDDGVMLESWIIHPDWIHGYVVNFNEHKNSWLYASVWLEWPNSDAAEPMAIAVYTSGVPYLPPSTNR